MTGNVLNQGSPPIPGPRISAGPRPVKNQAAQQEVSGGQVSEASSAARHRPHCSRYRLNHIPPTPSVEKLSSMKPVPGAKKVGDRGFTHYRVLVTAPDDLELVFRIHLVPNIMQLISVGSVRSFGL